MGRSFGQERAFWFGILDPFHHLRSAQRITHIHMYRCAVERGVAPGRVETYISTDQPIMFGGRVCVSVVSVQVN